MKASLLFEVPEGLPFREFFLPEAAPWEWVKSVSPALEAFDFAAADSLKAVPPGVHLSGKVHLASSVKLPPYCVIEGPAFIGPETEIRPGAYIRGNVIAGRRCVLGNSCEYKNCLLLDRVETAHFNYVGDSVLGNGTHLGAGVVLANLKLSRDDIFAQTPEGRLSTGLRKLGAMLGDGAEVGCNAVLQPGTILGKKARVMPAIAFGGYLQEATIAHAKQPPARIGRQ